MIFTQNYILYLMFGVYGRAMRDTLTCHVDAPLRDQLLGKFKLFFQQRRMEAEEPF